MGIDCGVVCGGGALVPSCPIRSWVRFLVTASAMVVMFEALQAGYHAVAAVFGALALFCNPVAPAFSFSGDWQRCGGDKRRPLRSVTRLAQWKDCEDQTQ